jgi:serine/threonine protein phosphatase PrpC
MMLLKHGVATDTGNVRPQNEDAYVASERLFAVADGMGGHNAGEVASALATTLLLERATGQTLTPEWFVEAISAINRTIHESAAESTERRGMGTTICALALVQPQVETNEPPQVALANVGDSRIYLWRAGTFRQLSVDHSYVQELVTEGLISEEEARVHPRRNIVTRALGIDERVAVDSWLLPVFSGDRFILCSDGLVDEVPTANIADLAAQQREPQVVADALVALAKRNGGRDNITVIVVDAVGDVIDNAQQSFIGEPVLEKHLTKSKTKWVIGVVVALTLLISLVITGRNARSGYFLTFENSTESAAVCIDRGSSTRVLWFSPTRELCTDLMRNDLIPALQRQIDNHSRLSTFIDAQRYVAALKEVSALNDK